MKRLLLLEDDRALGATLTERLGKQGYSVEWAVTQSAAQQHLSQSHYDLILIDISLPDGNGFDFARHVRRTTQVPFVFLTALSSAEYRLQGYELGAAEFIPKPFHLRELLLRVERLLNAPPARLPARFEFQDLTLDFDTLTVGYADGTTQSAQPKDFALLRLLIDRAPAVVSRAEIVSEVWPSDKDSEESTSSRSVDNAIVRLRQLLDPRADKGKDFFIKSVRGVGYQWVAGD